MEFFGPFLLDTSASRLAREGVEIRLRLRAFHSLRVLLQHHGEFVGYEAMMAEAWEGTHVGVRRLEERVVVFDLTDFFSRRLWTGPDRDGPVSRFIWRWDQRRIRPIFRTRRRSSPRRPSDAGRSCWSLAT